MPLDFSSLASATTRFTFLDDYPPPPGNFDEMRDPDG